MKIRKIARRNPVARALRDAAFKNRVVQTRNRDEKRAKDKLRRSLREYRTSPALFNSRNCPLVD
jgi:hypothetical protein